MAAGSSRDGSTLGASKPPNTARWQSSATTELQRLVLPPCHTPSVRSTTPPKESAGAADFDLSTTHVMIVVPKRDEVRAAASVFGFDFSRPDELIGDRYETWTVTVAGLLCTIVLADRQGSTNLALATAAGLSACDPALSICVGTAAGRDRATSYLDVVIAGSVLDASEWRAEPAGMAPQWEDKFEPGASVRHDVSQFLNRRDWHPDALATLKAAPVEAGEEVVLAEAAEGWPRLHDGWVVTTDFLHQDPQLLGVLWNVHARLRAVDMETAGFVKACEGDSRKRLWCVIRAVSDYGTKESKRDSLRPAAGLAAAIICREFVVHGLQRSHPLATHPKESGQTALSDQNFFAGSSILSYVKSSLSDVAGVALDHLALEGGPTVRDVVAMHSGLGVADGVLAAALDQARERYFTEKYLDYEDQADVRGHVGPTWADEVQLALDETGVELSNSDVLYVGVGTGRDLSLVCPNFATLAGVDISSRMLERAQSVEHRLRPVHGTAEQLVGIGDSSVDVYLSLRTYQSSLFDASSSLAQAYRVLRPGGSIVLSIPASFVDKGPRGELRVVPGLLVPGSTVVDPERPRRIGSRIIRQMERLMFERIGFHQWDTDLYIYARKRPGGHGIDTPSLS